MKNIIMLIFVMLPAVALSKGNCRCPDDVDKRGNICGKRSAFCRSGGDRPMCGASDESERSKFFNKICYKSL